MAAEQVRRYRRARGVRPHPGHKFLVPDVVEMVAVDDLQREIAGLRRSVSPTRDSRLVLDDLAERLDLDGSDLSTSPAMAARAERPGDSNRPKEGH